MVPRGVSDKQNSKGDKEFIIGIIIIIIIIIIITITIITILGRKVRP